MSDENGDDGDLVVKEASSKKRMINSVIMCSFPEDDADSFLSMLHAAREAKDGETAVKGQPSKFHGEHSVIIDNLKPESDDQALVKCLGVSINTVTDAPACSALVVKAGSSVNGIIIVLDAARLVKFEEEPDAPERLTEADEKKFCAGVTMIAGYTELECTPMLILVKNTGSLKGERSDEEWKAYCKAMETEIMLNLVEVEHSVMVTSAHVCRDDELGSAGPGMEWLMYQLARPKKKFS